MTSYAEAVREVAAARSEVPSRRGYPGYLYARPGVALRARRTIQGEPGPGPASCPDDAGRGRPTRWTCTGYITEGGSSSRRSSTCSVYPPFALSSLSRLMRLGAGPSRTRDDHL